MRENKIFFLNESFQLKTSGVKFLVNFIQNFFVIAWLDNNMALDDDGEKMSS